jgi:hypothetical protein
MARKVELITEAQWALIAPLHAFVSGRTSHAQIAAPASVCTGLLCPQRV